jgi:cystathionine beta-lyase/cystathionine gamma-synthase
VSDEPSPATRAVTAGRGYQGSSLNVPLWGTSTWSTDGLDDTRKRATGMRPGDFYSRYANPTVRAFEEAIAELEGAEDALAFGSGMGAIASTVLALCSAGDHVVIQRQIYAGTIAFVQGPCARLGIEHTVVDGTRPGAFAEAVRPGRTMLVIAESPSNPRLDLIDLDELGGVSGPFTVLDSTFATPIGQQPLRHGIDLVLHSATKGICGHNDATLGVIAGASDLLDAIWAYGVLHGAAASPFDALNGLRGVRTLAVRQRHQASVALRLADALASHPGVAGGRALPRPAEPPSAPPGRPAVDVHADRGRHRSRRRCRRRPHDARRAAHRPTGDLARRPGDARLSLGDEHPRQPVGRRAGGDRYHARAGARVGRPGGR